MKNSQIGNSCWKNIGLLILILISTTRIHSQLIWNGETLLNAQQRSVAQEALALDVHGKPHVILSGDGIHHKWCDNAGWHEENVYSSQQPVLSPSINISPDGTVHVIFTEDNNVIYGCRVGDSWTFDTLGVTYRTMVHPIRIDSEGNPHTAFINSDSELVYAVKRSDEWSVYCTTGEPLGYYHGALGFDLDSTGYPHFVIRSMGVSWHVTYRDSEWLKDAMSGVSTNMTFFSMDIDGMDEIHGVFQSNSSGSPIKYIHKSDGEWSIENVNVTCDKECRLFMDSLNNPHICLISEGRLMHLHRDDSGWIHDTLDSYFDYQSTPAALMDDSGNFHMVADNKDLSCILYFLSNDSNWDIVKISEYGSFGNADLVIDEQSNPHAVFTACYGNKLQYAGRKNQTWNFETIDELMGIGSGQCHIGIDASGVIHISYYNALKRTLYHGWRTEAGWNREVVSEGVEIRDSTLFLAHDWEVWMLYSTETAACFGRKSNGSWQYETFEPGTYGSVALCMDESYQPHCAYYRLSESGWGSPDPLLFHRYREQEGWIEERIAGSSEGTVMQPIALQADRAGVIYLAYVMKIRVQEGYDSYVFLGVNSGHGWQRENFGYGWYVKLNMDQYDRLFLFDGHLNFRSDDGRWMKTYNPFRAYVFECAPDDRFQGISANKDGLTWSWQELPREGLRLEMPSDESIHWGWIYLNAYLRSDYSALHQAPLCILLEYQHNYWFWPEWTGQFNVEYVDVNEKGSALLPIPAFDYKASASLTHPLEGLTFWGALLNDDLTEILGGVDGIGKWEFSIQ